MPSGSARICCPRDSGREVLQLFYLMARRENPPGQLDGIEPAERRALDGPIIEIETIDIDVGFHCPRLENSKGHSEKRPLS